MNTEHYHTLVIGSGGGTKIIQALNKLGIRSALIEKDRTGGTCLNRGCIPSKMLIYPSGAMAYVEKLKRLHVTAGIQDVDFEALIASINSYTDDTSSSIGQHFEQADHVDYYRGEARFVRSGVLEVGGRRLSADRIIIATGSRPFIPDIEGLADTPYMTSTEALRNRELPNRLIVLGGGFIAAELGGAYAGFGTEVHMVVRSRLLKHEDREILQEFRSEYDEGKFIYEHTDVLRVSYEDSCFTVETEDEKGHLRTLEAEALLVATGVIPNSDTLGLEHTDVETDSAGYICVNNYLETSEPGVFAIGDVAGNYLFRHSVNFEGEYWVDANLISSEPFPIQYPPMPGAVFTHPEIASVGVTEERAAAEGMNVVIGRADYTSCAMAVARGVKHGMVKLLFEASTGKLVGAHLVGDEASTMIQENVLACTLGLTAQEMYRQIYIHPAYPEVVRNALRDALKQLDETYRIRF